ncbi:MAG TPA: T9SS type A sorting domain-containing protein, partial [Candidatus Cloacimonadota bacterium]|nr:T9SS type A sorting domain-containing protein [Candidatus Cloacimonadota bacterium]
ELTGNYPNPFNPTTTIAFTLDKTQDIEMDIFNIKGQRVKKLIKKDSYSSGNHNIIWNGQNDSSEICPSGIYFYRLKTANKTFTGKMLMLK